MSEALPSRTMRTRHLGDGGPEVTVVGLGCNNFGGRVGLEGARAVVDAALDAGVTLFDTADIYGNGGGSEELLGEVLEGRRDRMVLATKWLGRALSLNGVILTIPFHEPCNTLFDCRGRAEPDIAFELGNIGVCCLDIAGLHRKHFLYRRPAELLLQQR